MSVKIRPTEASKVARLVWAIISEQKDGVSYYILICVAYPNIIIRARGIGAGVLVEAFIRVVGEYHVRCGSLWKGS